MSGRTCADCGSNVEPLNPAVEEWIEHKFCIRLPFGWKLMLLRDTIEYGCTNCLVERDQARESEMFDRAVGDAISEEIRAGRLIQR